MLWNKKVTINVQYSSASVQRYVVTRDADKRDLASKKEPTRTNCYRPRQVGN